ncbi:snRNA-activating protein complex subunit 1b [Sphaeramia orbicularis]|uniref:Small nuclear RNA activating complex, polypeptide 1b n=1 Tax=Sphaeramia orbicularis TaxID=375764 RepID=A0A673BFG9_9TELE|nr:snRNA-activating protein complex subunit 1 [Sphaeramia orbicularis]
MSGNTEQREKIHKVKMINIHRKHLKSDYEELLSRFQQTDTVRFEIFSKIWREMKFAEIFYGTVRHERRAFSRLALDVASSFFLPPFSFQIRVGGLYLLYGLWTCQLTSPSEQIRLALKDWEDVQKFEKDAVDAQHLDVVYIFRKLMSQKAFHFTAMPGLLSFKKQRKIERSMACEEFMERASRPQELINNDLLEELSNIHELYNNLKTSVCPKSEETNSSVHLIHQNLVPQLQDTVMDFYNWQQMKDGPDETEADEDSGEGTSSQHQSSRRAELLASIKSKAYGQAAEASKSRRHRQVELDVTANKAGPDHTEGDTKKRKLSLKCRTTKNVHISGDIWKESTTFTQINRLTKLDSVPEEKEKRAGAD